jgi:DNA-binding MarR family transcriptional regulator
MVKQSGQPLGALPARPASVPDDERHRTANVVHSAALRLLRRASTADSEMDLDGPRASVLSILVFAGPQAMSRLAAFERVSAPAITKTVAALEEAGLARRARSTADQRVILVQATEAGRALLERGRAARIREVAALLAGASERDLATLRRAADIIAKRM